MLNKKSLKMIEVPLPQNIEQYFTRYNAVINFNVVTVDRKRILVVDTVFENGRKVRTFIHKTSKSFDFVNLVNGKNWSMTALQDLSKGKGESTQLWSCYQKVLNADIAEQYFKDWDRGSVVSYITSKQYEKQYREDKIGIAMDKALKKIPRHSLTKSQFEWLKKEVKAKKNKRGFFYIIEKVNDVIIIRHINAQWRKNDIYTTEPVRTVYLKGKFRTYFEDCFFGGWATGGGGFKAMTFFRPGKLYPNFKKLNNTDFKYSAVELLRDKEFKVHKYLKFFVKFPQAERIIKDRLSELALELSEDNDLHSSLNPTAKNSADFLNICRHRFKLLKAEQGNYSSALALQEAPNDVSDNNLINIINIAKINRYTALEFLKTVKELSPTVNKIMKYIAKSCDDYNYKSMEIRASLYKDYIGFCKKLGYDLKDKSVLFPKDLTKAHDTASEAVFIKENKKLANDYRKLKNKLSPLNDMVIGDYIFRIPTCNTAFVKHGEALKQCVGNGTYFKSMAAQQKLIVFVNKADEPDTPYLTLEIRNGANVQFRGFKNGIGDNSVLPPKDAELAVKHYLRKINQVLVFGKNEIKINKKKALQMFHAA